MSHIPATRPASASSSDGASRRYRRAARAAVRSPDKASKEARSYRDRTADPEATAETRREFYAGQHARRWTAATLLNDAAPSTAKGLRTCRMTPYGMGVGVMHDEATGRASFSGVRTCGQVWNCEACAARICAARRDEMNVLLSWARAEGYRVVLVTLTHRHKARDPLAANLDSMKRALRRLRERREYRGLQVVGSVTATEITHGANGFHVHYHCILLLSAASEADALASVEALRAPWLRSLEAFGLTGNRFAFDARGASDAGAYVTKGWNAASEVTLTGTKAGRAGSRTPGQLLHDATDGDLQAGAIWREYALAVKGRKALTWSNGLKARAGVADVEDADASADGEPDKPLPRLVRFYSPSEWREVRSRSAAILAAVEFGTCIETAERGMSDARWWAHRTHAPVIESDVP